MANETGFQGPFWKVDRDVIQAYAEQSGDFNPLHVDEEYGASTEFGRCIAHGPIALNVFLAGHLGAEGWQEGLELETKYIAPTGSGDAVNWRWTEGADGGFEVVRDDGTAVIVGKVR